MSQAEVLEAGEPAANLAPEEVSLFQRIADKVSYGMGTPANIGVWIIIVVGWTLLFALHAVNARGTFLPTWFTSTGYNFPLNLVTTVAELYIGFLVGASSNRSERNLERTLSRISAQDDQIDAVEIKLSEALAQNTALTKEIHELTRIIHKTVCAGEASGAPAGV
jgi:low affinity Fe/Cu permease